MSWVLAAWSVRRTREPVVKAEAVEMSCRAEPAPVTACGAHSQVTPEARRTPCRAAQQAVIST